jgi:hypothetical protein
VPYPFDIYYNLLFKSVFLQQRVGAAVGRTNAAAAAAAVIAMNRGSNRDMGLAPHP